MTEAEKREKRGFVQSAGAARRIAPRRPAVSTTDVIGNDWKGQFRRFEQLYWVELSMVEDDGVKEAMQSLPTSSDRSVWANVMTAISRNSNGGRIFWLVH